MCQEEEEEEATETPAPVPAVGSEEWCADPNNLLEAANRGLCQEEEESETPTPAPVPAVGSEEWCADPNNLLEAANRGLCQDEEDDEGPDCEATPTAEGCEGDEAPDCEATPTAEGCEEDDEGPDCEATPTAEGCEEDDEGPDCETTPTAEGCEEDDEGRDCEATPTAEGCEEDEGPDCEATPTAEGCEEDEGPDCEATPTPEGCEAPTTMHELSVVASPSECGIVTAVLDSTASSSATAGPVTTGVDGTITAYSFSEGATVKVTATNANSVLCTFTGLSGACTRTPPAGSTDPDAYASCTITMGGPKTVTATFEKAPIASADWCALPGNDDDPRCMCSLSVQALPSNAGSVRIGPSSTTSETVSCWDLETLEKNTVQVSVTDTSNSYRFTGWHTLVANPCKDQTTVLDPACTPSSELVRPPPQLPYSLVAAQCLPSAGSSTTCELPVEDGMQIAAQFELRDIDTEPGSTRAAQLLSRLAPHGGSWHRVGQPHEPVPNNHDLVAGYLLVIDKPGSHNLTYNFWDEREDYPGSSGILENPGINRCLGGDWYYILNWAYSMQINFSVDADLGAFRVNSLRLFDSAFEPSKIYKRDEGGVDLVPSWPYWFEVEVSGNGSTWKHGGPGNLGDAYDYYYGSPVVFSPGDSFSLTRSDRGIDGHFEVKVVSTTGVNVLPAPSGVGGFSLIASTACSFRTILRVDVDMDVPEGPQNFAASADGENVSLAWDGVWATSEVTQYELQYKYQTGKIRNRPVYSGDWLPVARKQAAGGVLGVAMRYTHSHDVQHAGKLHKYRIRAHNGIGAGEWVESDPVRPGSADAATTLLGMKDKLRGEGTLNWSTDVAIATWNGVTVSGTPQQVTGLELSGKGLSGTLPVALGGLSSLTTLDLSQNSLTGAIPDELSDLSLTTLRLSGNSGLTGCIPVALESVATNDLSSLSLLYCRPPAPASLAAATTGQDQIGLSWGAVSNTSKYRVEYRLGTETAWTEDSATVAGAAHTVDGLTCGTAYAFRASAYGSGTTYTAAWSDPSATLSVTTSDCTDPVFSGAPYSFSVAEDAASGTAVGTVTATSPGDTLTYTISAGNTSSAFAIDGSTGAITVAGSLDHETTASYTLTVTAEGAKGDSTDATVTVSVTDVDETPPTYLLTTPVSPAGCGTVTAKEKDDTSTPAAASSWTFPQRDDVYVRVTATAADGCTFSHWGLDFGGWIYKTYTNPTQFQLSMDMAATAHFTGSPTSSSD